MRLYLTTIFVSLLIFALQVNTLFAYGYKRDEDPLIKVFKDVVYYGKKNDWGQIAKRIDTINDRVNDVRVISHVDLTQGLSDAINGRDFQDLIKCMANLVFLAMGEKFYWNRSEKLTIHLKAKVRLRLAEEYYIKLLAGNVRGYDIKKETGFNGMIYQLFIDARKTIGSLGFFGVGAVKPDLEKFNEITDEIEKKLLIVFPYFEFR
ncbi:MAG: hypothetical protein ACUZ8O_02230 [Candidatus Anammoxibacter sp.]